MEKIYRIQDKKGRGPFKPGFSHEWVEWREDHRNLLPFYDDFGYIAEERNHLGKVFGCGCRTKKQLKRWFTESEYKRLLDAGYHAVKMNVDKVIAESDIQLVFARKRKLKYGAKKIKLYNTGEKVRV